MPGFPVGGHIWVLHRCTVKGCAEGYVTVDGNEKLRRPICAAPKSHVQLRPDLPTIVQCCTNYPVHGGKSQAASKYCELHARYHDIASDSTSFTHHHQKESLILPIQQWRSQP